jgi:TrmH family RNA methyltransferase
MITKNQIKHISSLKIKKYRHEHGEFAVEGEKCVDELLRSGFDVCGIYAFKKWISLNSELLTKKKPEVYEITEDELRRISSFDAPNKVIAIAKIPGNGDPTASIFSGLVLCLDNIRDPGNLGMIIRTADWFGIKNIVCSAESVDAYNSKVVQSSMGSLFRVDVRYTDLRSFISGAPEKTRVYGSVLDGDDIFKKKLDKNGIIIIGNESKGISESLMPLVTERLMIPPFAAPVNEPAGGNAESLNAALAAAILCYEFRRQNCANEND